MVLSKYQCDRYSEQGWLAVEGLVPPGVLRKLQDKVAGLTEAAQAELERGSADPTNRSFWDGTGSGAAATSTAVAPVTANRPRLRKIDAPSRLDPFFRQAVAEPAVIDAVRALTGSPGPVLLYNDQLLLKPAHCGSEKPWHQDQDYFRVRPEGAGITCWTALDDATVENGCMRYVSGSHRWGLVDHRQIEGTPHHVPVREIPMTSATHVPVAAGTVIFHGLLTAHGSGGNQSPHPRRAWARHYVNGGLLKDVGPTCPGLLTLE